MWKLRTLFVGLIMLASLVIVAAALPGTHRAVKCTPGYEAHDGSCTDPVGDVKGGPGPDITRVTELQWGIIVYVVTFAKPLAHTATFTDTVTAQLWTTGPSRRYELSVSAAHPTKLVIRQLPNGKAIVKNRGAAPYLSGRRASLGVMLTAIGDPQIVRCRVKAARETVNAQPGGVDYAPNSGTLDWGRWSPPT